MNKFICLTSMNGSNYIINVNHIVGFYSPKGENITVIETDSSLEGGRFLVKEPVSYIFDTIRNIQKGGLQ